MGGDSGHGGGRKRAKQVEEDVLWLDAFRNSTQVPLYLPLPLPLPVPLPLPLALTLCMSVQGD